MRKRFCVGFGKGIGLNLSLATDVTGSPGSSLLAVATPNASSEWLVDLPFTSVFISVSLLFLSLFDCMKTLDLSPHHEQRGTCSWQLSDASAVF